MIFYFMDTAHWFNHLIVNGHEDCFHFLAVMNNGAMNIRAQVLWGSVFISLGNILGEELLGQMVTVYLMN